jgi:hypothetical protein
VNGEIYAQMLLLPAPCICHLLRMKCHILCVIDFIYTTYIQMHFSTIFHLTLHLIYFIFTMRTPVFHPVHVVCAASFVDWLGFDILRFNAIFFFCKIHPRRPATFNARHILQNCTHLSCGLFPSSNVFKLME